MPITQENLVIENSAADLTPSESTSFLFNENKIKYWIKC